MKSKLKKYKNMWFSIFRFVKIMKMGWGKRDSVFLLSN